MRHPDSAPHGLLEALERVAGRREGFGASLSYFDVTESTNDVANAMAAAGAPHGALVVARAQTAGRGRQGRVWHSPPGAGLYFSCLLRPPLPVDPSVITLVAGVAMAEGIERACGLAPEIKWPNDLMAAAAPRLGRPQTRWLKLGGLLAEATIVGSSIQHVILGVGINVHESDYPTDLSQAVTSLEREVGRDVDEHTVLAQCVAALAERWHQLQSGRLSSILDEWRRRSPSANGAPVTIDRDGTSVSGRTRGLSDDGALLVEVAGSCVRVTAGEVVWQ